MRYKIFFNAIFDSKIKKNIIKIHDLTQIKFACDFLNRFEDLLSTYFSNYDEIHALVAMKDLCPLIPTHLIRERIRESRALETKREYYDSSKFGSTDADILGK